MSAWNDSSWTGAPLRLDLALQGGGSHGAFTWGVLDRLLEDEAIAFDAISGTSAGAVNAAVLATGLVRGGRAGAREALRAFWEDVSCGVQVFSPFALSQSRAAADNFNFDRLESYRWIGHFLRAFSPYEFNPLNINPLRDVVQRHVDEAALRRCQEPRGPDDAPPLRLFVTATSVQTGQGRVFSGEEVGIDALLASACLPTMFQAVEIDGEPYWDGGYSGNPAIFPLLHRADALDVLLVKINPLRRDTRPVRSVEILDRLSEITFNAGLIAEMRALQSVARLWSERSGPGPHKALRLHMVADDEGLAPFNASSKLNTDAAFVARLHGLGREAAARWLARHRRDIGRRSSLDIEREFRLEPAFAG